MKGFNPQGKPWTLENEHRSFPKFRGLSACIAQAGKPRGFEPLLSVSLGNAKPALSHFACYPRQINLSGGTISVRSSTPLLPEAALLS